MAALVGGRMGSDVPLPHCTAVNGFNYSPVPAAELAGSTRCVCGELQREIARHRSLVNWRSFRY